MNPQALPQQPTPITTPTSGPVPQIVLTNIPDVWPGAWGIYKYSKQVVRRNWGVLVLLFVANIAISITLGLIAKLAGQVIGELVGFIFDLAAISVLLASVRGQKMSFVESLRSVKPILYARYVVSLFFLGIALGVSLLLLIIPFFIIFPRLLFTPYFLIDKKMGPLKAIGASWDASKGHVGKIWGIIGASIAISLLSITIIGIPFAIYFLFMYYAAYVILYDYIIRSRPKIGDLATAPIVATAAPAMPPSPVIDPMPPQQTPIQPIMPQQPVVQPAPPSPQPPVVPPTSPQQPPLVQ